MQAVPLESRISKILNDREHAAAVTLLFRLLRETPGLRQWMRAACLDARISRNLDAWLDNRHSAPPGAGTGRGLLAWLAGLDTARTADASQLRHQHAGTAPSYGGLTRAQLFSLIRRHQAGTLALAPFLLIHAWRRAFDDKTATPAAMLATEAFFREVITQGKTALFRQLSRAWEFFQGNAPGIIGRTHFGHAAWWQLNVLAYMLTHPKPAYRTREFSKHLKGLKIPVDTADLRRFCRRHRIARDTRPGRPRN
jgi:hypothetical protein